MERVIVLKDGAVVNDVPLKGKKLSIGRDATSDIQLKDFSVSRQHARLIRVFADYYVEDLGSTNGTYLNNRQVTKHMLTHGDLLHIGNFNLRFLIAESGQEEDNRNPELEDTVVIPPQRRRTRATAAAAPERRVMPKTATVRFSSGPSKGRSERINRSLYTIGRPGGDVAVIARRPQGFFLLHIGGDQYPKINSEEITSTKGVQLQEGDVLEVGENRVEISFG
jgi:predicted component of type VI protein secretion system